MMVGKEMHGRMMDSNLENAVESKPNLVQRKTNEFLTLDKINRNFLSQTQNQCWISHPQNKGQKVT